MAYPVLFLAIFSLFLISANALPGTCKNPAGGTYCGQHSGVSSCWCDTYCVTAGDCCDDYNQVCVPTGTCTDSDGGANYDLKGTATSSDGSSLTDDCVKNNVDGVLQNTGELLEAVCDGTSKKYITYNCPDTCNNGACYSEAVQLCFSTNTISQGQTKLIIHGSTSYEIASTSYEITASGIFNSSAGFIVNGQKYSIVNVSSTFVLANAAKFSLAQIIKGTALFCINGVAGKEIPLGCGNGICEGQLDVILSY